MNESPSDSPEHFLDLLDNAINDNYEEEKQNNVTIPVSFTMNSTTRNRRAPQRQNNDFNEQETIDLLKGMGFDANTVETIYFNIHPMDMQEALDYLNTNDAGLFTHTYIEGINKCTICNKGPEAHAKMSYVGNLNRNYRRPETRLNRSSSLGQRNSLQQKNTIGASRNSPNKEDDFFNEKFDSFLNYFKGIWGSNSESNFDNYNPYANPYRGPDVPCLICSDYIRNHELWKYRLICNHYFCGDCWYEYMKEKISKADVLKINCMQKDCPTILKEDFIKRVLGEDRDLKDKYNKFSERKRRLESNKNYKICPIPDCDGYAEKKSDKEKYVKCNYGHEFCFICYKPPHGNEPCEEVLDQDFEHWKKNVVVKRCPHCKFYTEKNEGCNHMTCPECKFQWCWLCLGKYMDGHYRKGCCYNLQFEKDPKVIEQKMEENRRKIKAGTLADYNYDVHNNAVADDDDDYYDGMEGDYNYFLDLNTEEDECCCNFFYKLGWVLVFIFFLPFLFVFHKYRRYNRNNENCMYQTFTFLLYVPWLIFFGVQWLLCTGLIGLPALFIWKYYRFLRRKVLTFAHTFDTIV